jgi:ribonuclease P protein component
VVAHVLRQPAGKARLGLAITKRVAPRAVDRNRVKRIVREVFRHAAPRLGAVDVVIKLKCLPSGAQWTQARAELETLFARLALTGEKS